jgi:flagellar hook-basal body complex protein FliE
MEPFYPFYQFYLHYRRIETGLTFFWKYCMVIREKMMYKVIEDEKEISRYQKEFKEILRNNGTEVFKNQPHGDPGAGGNNIKVDKYWSSKFEFWYAYVSLKERKNTHINLFGLTRPTGKSCSATVEINFPVKGINRRLMGIFAKDDKDKVIVVHRGKFQINLKKRKRLSPRNYNGKRIDIQDGDRKTNVILVGELRSSDFLENLSNFIKKVDKIKKIARKKQNEMVNR